MVKVKRMRTAGIGQMFDLAGERPDRNFVRLGKEGRELIVPTPEMMKWSATSSASALMWIGSRP
jgi:hypothetical protein